MAPIAWGSFYELDKKSNEQGFEYRDVEFWSKDGEMKYSRIRLIEQLSEGEKPNFVFFWKPDKNVVNASCFGQWQPSTFWVEADSYSCTEQYMMVEKARLFEDYEVAQQIMNINDPKEMKALGKRVRNFD